MSAMIFSGRRDRESEEALTTPAPKRSRAEKPSEAELQALAIQRSEQKELAKARSLPRSKQLQAQIQALAYVDNLEDGSCYSSISFDAACEIGRFYEIAMQSFQIKSGVFDVFSYDNPVTPGMKTVFLAGHDSGKIYTFDITKRPTIETEDDIITQYGISKMEYFREVSEAEIQVAQEVLSEAIAEQQLSMELETTELTAIVSQLASKAGLSDCILHETQKFETVYNDFRIPAERFVMQSGICEVFTFKRTESEENQTVFIAQHDSTEIVTFNIVQIPIVHLGRAYTEERLQGIRKLDPSEVSEAQAATQATAVAAAGESAAKARP